MNINDPTRDTRERVAALYSKGLTVRHIALAVGISTQRVYQILEALELPPPSQREAS